MKFNWGHGIFIFLTIFVLSMLFVVYKGFQQDNALVEKEYYPKGLAYQQQIDRISNANALGGKIKVDAINNRVSVTYPDIFKGKNPEGTLYFYRPSDDKGDFTEKMDCDSCLSQIFVNDILQEGKYIVKMNWKMEGKEYYEEQVLFVNHQ
jgi:hypothetical protein